MDVYLGIDVGTTHVKVVALGADGQRVTRHAPTPLSRDAVGPVHLPEAVVGVVRELAAAAVGALAGARLRGVCVASFGEEGVALDAAGRPLYPALAWYARRPSATAARFCAEHDPDATYRRCGLPQDAIHTLFQWAWLRDNAPSVLAGMRTWLSMSEYVAFVLSAGARAMSPSQASRTHAWSPFGEHWLEDWARAVGVDAAALPPIVAAGRTLGPLASAAVAGIPCAPDATVVMGGHDHAMGAWAAGVRAAGEALDSLGTAESVYVVAGDGAAPTTAGRLAALQHGRAVAMAGASPPHYVLAALHSGAGVAGLLRLFGRPLEALEREAGAVPPGAGGLRYTPPPWVEPDGGGFAHVPLDASPGVWLRAVFEGWARAAVAAIASVEREGGARVGRLRAIGGGSRSALAMAIRASMMNCPLEVVTEPELVALGAATMAMAAMDAGAAVPRLESVEVAPIAAWTTAYRELLAQAE